MSEIDWDAEFSRLLNESKSEEDSLYKRISDLKMPVPEDYDIEGNPLEALNDILTFLEEVLGKLVLTLEHMKIWNEQRNDYLQYLRSKVNTCPEECLDFMDAYLETLKIMQIREALLIKATEQ